VSRQVTALGWDLASVVIEREGEFHASDRVVAVAHQLGLGHGTQADFVALRSGRSREQPESVSFVEAATLPLAGL
jgi:NADPH:quinone reductase-like Zn-dependent oxidoreductase